MNVRYRVELSQSEREQLTALLSGGKHGARRLKRAQVLLAADAGAGDEKIARGEPDGLEITMHLKIGVHPGNSS